MTMAHPVFSHTYWPFILYIYIIAFMAWHGLMPLCLACHALPFALPLWKPHTAHCSSQPLTAALETVCSGFILVWERSRQFDVWIDESRKGRKGRQQLRRRNGQGRTETWVTRVMISPGGGSGGVECGGIPGGQAWLVLLACSSMPPFPS